MNAHIAKESNNGTMTRMPSLGPSPKATPGTMIGPHGMG